MTQTKKQIFLILAAAWRRRYAILWPILLMPIIATGLGALAPAKYHSHTSMLIQETAKMNPFLEDIAVSTQIKERINGLRTLLKSRHVLRTVAIEQGLITEETSPKDAEWVIQQISANLSVNQIGKDFVQIQLVSNKPEGMKAMLESVSFHFIEQLLAPERSSIQDSSEFLTIHIEERLKELQKAETELAEFQNENPTATPEFLNDNLKRLASLRQTLSEKQAQLAGMEKSLGSLDQQLSRTNPVLGKIEEKIIEIRSDLTLLRAKYTDAHSAVIANQRELQRLESEREKILSADTRELDSKKLWDIASSNAVNESTRSKPLLIAQLENLQLARAQFEALQEETKSIQVMIVELEEKNSRFGDVSATLANLTRNVAYKRELYEELVDRYEMAKLTGSLGMFEQNKRVKVIDLPYTPSRKSNLPLVIMTVIGLIAGIAIGSGVAIILELFDTRVYRADELEELTQAPVLTTIPNIKGAQYSAPLRKA